MVVVAMAIVAVLAVTVLWIALMNLQMKVTDEKNTDNFYSAEGVLDQICTGLQGRYFQGLLSWIYQGYGELL